MVDGKKILCLYGSVGGGFPDPLVELLTSAELMKIAPAFHKEYFDVFVASQDWTHEQRPVFDNWDPLGASETYYDGAAGFALFSEEPIEITDNFGGDLLSIVYWDLKPFKVTINNKQGYLYVGVSGV